MANNFLNQLQTVVDTGKLLGVTNIKDLYEHFKDSGIGYKDFKKQMHDYGIYGHLGKNDMARLSGMYYGSKNADFQEGRKAHMIDRDNGSLVYKDSNLAITPTLPLTITPLNIPVSRPVILKTAKNNSNKQLVAEDPDTYPTQELDNFYIDPEWFKDWYGAFSFNSNPQGLILPNSVRRFNEILMKNNYKGHLVTADEMRKLDNWNEIYNMIKYNNPHAKLYQNTTSKYPVYLKYGGNLNKFQQGGKTSSQQDAVMQFVQAIAEALQTDPNLVVQAAQANPEALKSAVQVYQLTLDIQLAAQTFALALQLKTQAAKHGAKLNYLKSLKNKCAEDEELYYFKKGGKAGCGCKKKEDGGKVEDKKESVVSKFKKACGGSKMKFRTGGLTPKQNPKINPNDTVMVKGKPFVLTNSDGTSVNPELKYPLYKGKVEEEDRKKAKAGDQDAKKRLDKRDTMEGDKKGGILKKSCGSKMPKEKCGAVMKFKNRKK